MQAGLPASLCLHGAAQPSRLAEGDSPSTGCAGAQGLDGENAVIRWCGSGKPTHSAHSSVQPMIDAPTARPDVFSPPWRRTT
jgi:hypothetical protein